MLYYTFLLFNPIPGLELEQALYIGGNRNRLYVHKRNLQIEAYVYNRLGVSVYGYVIAGLTSEVRRQFWQAIGPQVKPL